MELLQCISFFLSSSWKFFTEVQVPGLDISFAALFVGLLCAVLGLRFLYMILGVGFSGGGIVSSIKSFGKDDKK